MCRARRRRRGSASSLSLTGLESINERKGQLTGIEEEKWRRDKASLLISHVRGAQKELEMDNANERWRTACCFSCPRVVYSKPRRSNIGFQMIISTHIRLLTPSTVPLSV
jgi:hypothetical protein